MLTRATMTDTPLPDLLTVRDVLKLTQCNRTTLYRWMDAGLFPKPKKIGKGRNGSVRWSRLAVEAWARQS